VRIVVLAQDEPVLMAPYLAQLLEARRNEVVAVGLGPLRDTGNAPKTRRGRIRRVRTLWHLLEPRHFVRFLALRTAWRLGRRFGVPTGGRSLDLAARKLGIPVLRFVDPNRPDFVDTLRRLSPDVILNQSDRLLRRPLLSVPRIGVINRHGSRLPDHRGRLASFWQHREGRGEQWITVHFVDEGLDSGPIILQRSFSVDPSAPYGEVLERLFERSAAVVLEALELLERPDFVPLANPADEGSAHRHPTLVQAREWRREVAARRR